MKNVKFVTKTQFFGSIIFKGTDQLSVAYTGFAPLGFLGKGKNQMFWVKKELDLIIKGVFSPLKSIVENFLGASRHFIFKIYRSISLLSKISTAYLINNYSYMHYASVWQVFPKILKDTFKFIVRGLQR